MRGIRSRLRTSILLLLLSAFAATGQTASTNLVTFLTTNRFPDDSTINVEAVSYGAIHRLRITPLPEQEPKFLTSAPPTIVFTTVRHASYGRSLDDRYSDDVFTKAEALDTSGNWYPLHHDGPMAYSIIGPITELPETWDFPNSPKPSAWIRVRIWATRNEVNSACVEFKLPNDAVWREHSIKDETNALHSPKTLNGELWLAAGRGDLTSVKVLIAQGADPNSSNSSGASALVIALQYDHSEVARYLLDHGADVNAHSKPADFTALMTSSYDDSRLAITRLLVERGASVNIQGQDGRTALMDAANAGGIETVKYLISKGANPNIKNRDGKTAIEEAEKIESTNRLEIIRILKTAQAPH